MSLRKKISLFLILSIIGFVIGIFLLKFYECGNSISCYNLTTRSFAIFYGMPALALVFLVLLFRPQAFPAWKKFAVWFIPLATLLFVFYSGPSSGDYFSPYPEDVFKWVSILYVVASIFVISKALRK